MSRPHDVNVLTNDVVKHRATYLAPVGIGLTLFTLHLFLVAWTGCSLNPARSLGPAAVAGKFPQNHWIYWIAPLCGGVLSVMYFQLLKALNYNSTVLDQDSDHEVGGLRPVHMQ
jgi:aquaporin related protein